ncbi:MAG: hypothetical protein LBK44_03460 [Spirochaetales bacterium]|nr:hypothetical protein [Spirochaetales bacterium]
MRFLWAFRYNPSRPAGFSRFARHVPLGVVSRLRRLKSKRPRLRVCHHAQRVMRCARLYHLRLTATTLSAHSNACGLVAGPKLPLAILLVCPAYSS